MPKIWEEAYLITLLKLRNPSFIIDDIKYTHCNTEITQLLYGDVDQKCVMIEFISCELVTSINLKRVTHCLIEKINDMINADLYLIFASQNFGDRLRLYVDVNVNAKNDDSVYDSEEDYIEENLIKKDDVNPSEDNLINKKDEVDPSENNIKNKEDDVAPSENNLINKKDGVNPSENNIKNKEDNVAPSENNIKNKEDDVAPSENNLINKEDDVNPSENNLKKEEETKTVVKEEPPPPPNNDDNALSVEEASINELKLKLRNQVIFERVRNFIWYSCKPFSYPEFLLNGSYINLRVQLGLDGFNLDEHGLKELYVEFCSEFGCTREQIEKDFSLRWKTKALDDIVRLSRDYEAAKYEKFKEFIDAQIKTLENTVMYT